MKDFKSLSEAEAALHIDYVLDSGIFREAFTNTPTKWIIPEDVSLSPIFNCSPDKHSQPQKNRSVGDLVKEFLSCFKSLMSVRLKSQILNHLFKLTLVDDGGLEFFKFVKADFLPLSVRAMETLYKEGKHNLVYHLSKCFESPAPRMDLNRMPYGLIDYNVRFFSSNKTQKLGMEEHYASWLETMFSQFGHKWLCLHRGPVWQYEVEPQVGVYTYEVDGSNVDIIQSALEQSSLSPEESSDSLMDGESVAVPFCSSPSLEENVREEKKTYITQMVLKMWSTCATCGIVFLKVPGRRWNRDWCLHRKWRSCIPFSQTHPQLLDATHTCMTHMLRQ